jgi:hypothetical protein
MLALGQLISWALLWVFRLRQGALLQPLIGTRGFNPICDTLWTILVLVLLHGALRVRKDMGHPH